MRVDAKVLASVVGLLAVGGAAVALAAAPSGGHGTTTFAAPLSHSVFRGARIPAGMAAPNFRLHDENGVQRRLSDARGKLVLLAFLYTKCTDVCPIIAVQLDSVVRSLGKRAGDVRVLAVSVDPKGDTPERVREYMRSHRLGPQFHWLMGTRQQLWPVWHKYNVAVAPAQDSNTIAHTAPVLLIDRRGKLRVYFQQPQRVRVMSHDVRLLLRTARR